MREPVTQERVVIDGPRTPQGALRLSGELAYMDPVCSAALLLNPHPFMGGTMNNPLIRCLARALPTSGTLTLRFDYRGVGESEGQSADIVDSMMRFWETGHAPDDPRLIDDARGALHWLAAQVTVPIVLVGYSFGAYVAACLSAEHPRPVSLIAPTLATHAFPTDGTRDEPLQVIYSDNDFATPLDVTTRWIGRLSQHADTQCLCGADHFFRGREEQVAAIVRTLIDRVAMLEVRP